VSISDFNTLTALLQSTFGRKEKEGYLEQYKDNQVCREILHFLFNPFIVTGLSDKKLNKALNDNQISFFGEEVSSEPAKTDILELLEFVKTHNTGKDGNVKNIADSIKALPYPVLVAAIVKKDLKLGVDAKTLNKVYGENFVPTFDIMLAEKFEDYLGHVEANSFILTEKLDGVRCVLLFENGNPQFFSRQGKPIDQLIELEIEVSFLNKNYVYDGELLLKNDGNLSSGDLYRKTVTITSSDNEKKGIIFHIFDKIDKEDFVKGFSEINSLDRKMLLHEELKNIKQKHAENTQNLAEVEMLYVGTDMTKISQLLDKYVALKKEGIMLNISNAPYENKRTKNLLKVKKFHTADVLVVDVEEGTSSFVGMLGAVIVKFEHEGKAYTCKVGSGFKQDEREFFWQNKNEILGKIIEIGYFDITKNQKNADFSLRFPTFKHLRADKSDISMH